MRENYLGMKNYGAAESSFWEKKEILISTYPGYALCSCHNLIAWHSHWHTECPVTW